MIAVLLCLGFDTDLGELFASRWLYFVLLLVGLYLICVCQFAAFRLLFFGLLIVVIFSFGLALYAARWLVDFLLFVLDVLSFRHTALLY